jgi:hypothetical protein
VARRHAAVVNGFGTGVADDKLIHAHVEDMVRFYLGAEPLIEAVPTLALGEPGRLDAVLDDLRTYVVKPRFGHGGAGVVVCAHADEDELGRMSEALRANPAQFIAQPIVALSCHPTVVDPGRLEPRHVDLRPFVFSAGVKIGSIPGGLTRVAWDAGLSWSTPRRTAVRRTHGCSGRPAEIARGWAAWQPSQPYTVGLEEEVMLLNPDDWSLAQRSDDVLPQLPDRARGARERRDPPGRDRARHRSARHRRRGGRPARGAARVARRRARRPGSRGRAAPAPIRSRCGATRASRPPAATR